MGIARESFLINCIVDATNEVLFYHEQQACADKNILECEELIEWAEHELWLDRLLTLCRTPCWRFYAK